MTIPAPEQASMQEALESLVPIINESVNEWLQDQSPEQIRKKVFDALNEARDTIAPKLLGFTKDSWGRGWQIDHCNGRAGESVLGDYLKKHQTEGIKVFLDQLNFAEVKPLTKTEIESIRKEYRYHLLRYVSDSIREKAHADAERLASQVSSTDIVQTILETQKLIGAGFTFPEELQPKE